MHDFGLGVVVKSRLHDEKQKMNRTVHTITIQGAFTSDGC